ncbi:MAG: hypothetical protein Q4C74_05655 [Rothia sp. (in: high G+C Gram-positive bacteria)]|nr:hypothetical protein [Rothia sp. (in: high G+C Gram-positive bacteria)]
MVCEYVVSVGEEVVLEVDGITLSHGGRDIVRDVSFRVRRHETLLLNS